LEENKEWVFFKKNLQHNARGSRIFNFKNMGNQSLGRNSCRFWKKIKSGSFSKKTSSIKLEVLVYSILKTIKIKLSF